MAEALRERVEAWGAEVLKLDVKDLVLPGKMKQFLNQVIEAEKKAAAQVILRREEVASTRSLANTAQMLERNPALPGIGASPRTGRWTSVDEWPEFFRLWHNRIQPDLFSLTQTPHNDRADHEGNVKCGLWNTSSVQHGRACNL